MSNVTFKAFFSYSFSNCYNCVIKMTNGSINCLREELDLGITLKGGQSFRWTSLQGEPDTFRGVFAGNVWTLRQNDNSVLHYELHGSLKNGTNYEEILSNYFRLDVSLKSSLEKWASVDNYFKTAYDKIGAVRILNQDPVENLFSFICSSNNNIIRISGMVEKLCKNFGNKLCTVDDKDYYDFPSIESLASSDVESILRKEGFGYRAGYISKSAQKLKELGGKNWLRKLHNDSGSSYEDARRELMTLPGVGPKVADCISLMSLGHLSAIPVDTHIFQVACSNYLPHLSKQKNVTPKIHHEVSLYLRELWGPMAGWAQAVVFCVKINSNGDFNNRKKKRLKSKETNSSDRIKMAKP